MSDELSKALEDYKRLTKPRRRLAPRDAEKREAILDYLCKVTGQAHPRVAVEAASVMVRQEKAQRENAKRAAAQASAESSSPHQFGVRPAKRVTSVVTSAFEQGKRR